MDLWASMRRQLSTLSNLTCYPSCLDCLRQETEEIAFSLWGGQQVLPIWYFRSSKALTALIPAAAPLLPSWPSGCPSIRTRDSQQAAWLSATGEAPRKSKSTWSRDPAFDKLRRWSQSLEWARSQRRLHRLFSGSFGANRAKEPTPWSLPIRVEL